MYPFLDFTFFQLVIKSAFQLVIKSEEKKFSQERGIITS